MDGAAVELPEHGILGPDVAGFGGGAFAQGACIRHRHLALALPLLRDDRLKIVGLFLGEIVQEINDGPNHGDHKYQHHGGQEGERGAHLVAKQVLEHEEKELHC